ncbi:M48 family metalloprotease [Alloalcanivorax xenomutans]|uniref:M48 family metalloprotease n=1 Tax=Alloalcanivorax xenomutans TaxID=1094342 RepID=UPI0029343313|nr:M48 family metalloprotease [Alloalcanivorax xenomutans]WOD27171.1 M48 family metalloprotease [Alloalcanivorax xenomutans]
MIRAMHALILCLVVVLAAPPGRAQDLPDLGDPAAALLSTDQEYRLGRSWLRSLRGKTPIMTDPLVQDYVENLVYRLASFSDLHEPNLSIVVINSRAINAFAVPGGVIGLNAGLFLNAGSMDEVASVVAHEIAHVSQRHFTRRYVDSQRTNIAMLAAMLASIAVAVAGDAQAGMAGMAATQAGVIQSQLAYSRHHEREADRVGMQTLVSAGLDPNAMPRFFERLVEQQQFAGDPPEFLLTHPVTESRVADSRARARNLPHPKQETSLPFELVRARIQASFFDDYQRAEAYFQKRLNNGDAKQREAARYGLAMSALYDKKYDLARRQLEQLRQQDRTELWYPLGLAEVALAEGDYPRAIEMAQWVQKINPEGYPSSVLLARAYLYSKQPEKAVPVLEPLLRQRPDDPMLWSMAADAWGNSGELARAHRGRAEYAFLRSRDREAKQQMQFALKEASGQFALRSALNARLKEMERLSEEEF